MVGHGGSSAGSYLAEPTSPISSHCASIVATRTVRVNFPSLYQVCNEIFILPNLNICAQKLKTFYGLAFMYSVTVINMTPSKFK